MSARSRGLKTVRNTAGAVAIARSKRAAKKADSKPGKISASKSQQSETRYRGASRALRSLSSWIPPLVSGQTSMPRQERMTLISRSQDAYRNHLLAGAAINRNRTNIVGTGLIAHPAVNAKALGISEEEASELNQLFAMKWRGWAERPIECDIEATADFYGKQAEALFSSQLAGDVVALSPFRQMPGCVYGLKVQLIDGVRVSNPNEGPNTPTLVDGFELDDAGAPARVHIRRRHPSDKTTTVDGWDSYEVFGGETGRRRVMHVVNDKDQIGMVRGVPYLAAILEPLQQLDSYSRNELVAAVVSSLFTVFLKKEASQFGGPNDVGAFDGQSKNAAGDQTLSLGNGAIVDLAPGEDAVFADPKRPNAQFDPFFVAMVKQIGARLEIPLDELLLHYSSSYSAARAAMLQAWRYYTMRRWTLVQQFCQPFYELWFDECVARGMLPVANYADPERRAAYTACIWVGPARGAMDEEKEARAAKTRIEAGISNRSIETAAMQGEDWQTVQEQSAREVKLMKDNGTYIDPKPQPTARPDSEPKREPEDDETPEEVR